MPNTMFHEPLTDSDKMGKIQVWIPTFNITRGSFFDLHNPINQAIDFVISSR